MKNKQFYIEQRPDGNYAASRGGAQRASAIEPTQAKAIERAQEIDPIAAIHVERVRNTSRGEPDQWRKP
jgi:hypothetical protein